MSLVDKLTGTVTLSESGKEFLSFVYKTVPDTLHGTIEVHTEHIHIVTDDKQAWTLGASDFLCYEPDRDSEGL